MLKIYITGHRDIKDPEDIRKKIAVSLSYYSTLDKELVAISSIASGADTLFIDEAIKKNATPRIVLPFGLDDYEKDFKSSDLKHMQQVLDDCGGKYEVVVKEPPRSNEERENAYLQTGKKLVDECDIVLAVWDGNPAMGKGGTGDIVAYAQQQDKPVHIINATRSGARVISENEAVSVFNDLDAEAIRYKSRLFMPVWICGLVYGVSAVICFATRIVYRGDISEKSKYVLTVAEVVLLFLSYIFLVLLANRLKKKYLNSRRNAEFLRSIICFKQAKIPISIVKNPGFNVEKRVTEIERKAQGETSTVEEISDAKREIWCLAEEQYIYHKSKRIAVMTERMENIEWWLRCVKYVFFTTVACSGIMETVEITDVVHINFKYYLQVCWTLSIILPSVYASFEAVKHFNEWARSIKISGKIIRKLEFAKERVLKINNTQSLLSEAHALREILEIENRDWVERYDEKIIDLNV